MSKAPAFRYMQNVGVKGRPDILKARDEKTTKKKISCDRQADSTISANWEALIGWQEALNWIIRRAAFLELWQRKTERVFCSQSVGKSS